jgi:hypothetical protein
MPMTSILAGMRVRGERLLAATAISSNYFGSASCTPSIPTID